jgi:hypothetical protein
MRLYDAYNSAGKLVKVTIPGAESEEVSALRLTAAGLENAMKEWPSDATEALSTARAIIVELVEWAAGMGGFEAEVWTEAREFLGYPIENDDGGI